MKKEKFKLQACLCDVKCELTIGTVIFNRISSYSSLLERLHRQRALQRRCVCVCVSVSRCCSLSVVTVIYIKEIVFALIFRCMKIPTTIVGL